MLAINDNHDASLAYLSDGGSLFAASEERFSRQKHEAGLPQRCLEFLRNSDPKVYGDIETLIIASQATPIFANRLATRCGWNFQERTRQQRNTLLALYIAYQSAVFPHCTRRLEMALSQRLFKQFLPKARIVFTEHHKAHAALAFYTADTDEKQLVITADGMGDGISFSVSIQDEQGNLQKLFRQNAMNVLTTFYAFFTEWLGVGGLGDEGKLMGLAAYGDASDTAPLLRLYFRAAWLGDNRAFAPSLRPISWHVAMLQQLRCFPTKDIAAGVQSVFEEVCVDVVHRWIKRTGACHISLCGGAFANVKLCQRIAELPELTSLYVPPATGDDGLSLGAILWTTRQRLPKFHTAYLGNQYSDDELITAARSANCAVFRATQLAEVVAHHLAQEHLVALFRGKMEFGQRALGNRSILASARTASMKDRLNTALRRDDFMPFCPIIRREDTPTLFSNTDKVSQCLYFMTTSVDVTEQCRREAPAIVHVDGTARPQWVTSETNPFVYRVLGCYKRLTAASCLINTSFNLHGEPIVCTPDDAVRSFTTASLDLLVGENILIARNPLIIEALLANGAQRMESV